MISRFRIKKWAPLNLSTAQKVKLAQRADELGTRELARDMCPSNKRIQLISVAVFVAGLALLALSSGMPKFIAVLGIVLTVWGFVQLPIAIFHSVQNRQACVAWLSEIQKFYGKDRARYGN